MKSRNRGKKWKIFKIVLVAVGLFLVLIAVFGTMLYVFSRRSVSYLDTEKGTALTEDEAEKILLADISDEDWDTFETCNAAVGKIAGIYSDGNGYIAADDTGEVLNAVAKYVNSLYEDGKVSYYYADTEQVYWEYMCGLGAVYEPALEGYDSGSGTDISLQILTFDPFTSDQGGYAQVTGEEDSNSLSEYVDTDFGSMNVPVECYTDENVTLETLMNLPESNVFLWLGHGGFLKKQECSYLITGEQAEELSDTGSYELNVQQLCSVCNSGYGRWAIKPQFVETFISLEDAFVYLGACRSGQNDNLANAFLGKGAETVVVNCPGLRRRYL